MESPPLTPLRPFTPAKPTSPSQQRPISQRSSSFSSTHSVSIGRRRSSYSNRRLSNSSRFSNGYDEPSSPIDQRNRSVSGMGTLADELDSADDEDWEQGESMMVEEEDMSRLIQRDSTPTGESLDEPAQTDGSRDSGVDVGNHSYPGKAKHPRRKSSAIIEQPKHPPTQVEEEFSRELELAMKDISELARASSLPQADTTSRTLSALRDLSNQANIETLSHRLATSTNSTSTSLAHQTKALQSSMASLFGPLIFSSPLHPDDIDSLLALQSPLLKALPGPDPALMAQFAKLGRDTADLQAALASLLDSLQMGKQLATGAARHLKVTLGMVGDLRREHERAEEARFCIEREEWDRRLEARWCAGECREVVRGFESFADGLRKEIEGGGA